MKSMKFEKILTRWTLLLVVAVFDMYYFNDLL